MLNGETVLSGGRHPGTHLKIMRSTNGWYVGFEDADGLPYSRESVYFQYRVSAQNFLDQVRGYQRLHTEPQ